jgi:phosphomannomutase
MTSPVASFLGYSPVALTFGTSGLRGLVRDITDLEAYVNVKGAIRYLLAASDVQPGSTVVLAGDLRPSTERIMRASARAIVDTGCVVENAGTIPTPALVAHAIAGARAGVMVSGSHIPFDRNGIKLSRSAGEVLKSDEAGIAAEVARVRVEEYARTASESPFDATGSLKHATALPPLDRAAEDAYVKRYVTAFAPGGLAGQRIVVYQHSAVGRDVLPRILRELGAEAIPAGRTETFVPIDTENITEAELDRVAAMVDDVEKAAGPVDAVVSTDGDSDRPLVLAVVPPSQADARGRRVRFLPGDLLGIVVAEYLGPDAAAVPVSANDAVEMRMRERGVLLEKTRIGSPYVIAAIDALKRRGAPGKIVGWEANGGFLTGTDFDLSHGTLRALPTRDSTLPILATLYAAVDARVTLSALWSRLPARFGRSGLIDEFPVAASKAILAHLVPAGAAGEAEIQGDPRVAAACARFFTPALGFDAVVRVNVLDGVRITFQNGDVAHVRPSGNAPQLRIYANSDTQARADAIVDYALREPDGILRQMQRAFAGELIP